MSSSLSLTSLDPQILLARFSMSHILLVVSEYTYIRMYFRMCIASPFDTALTSL